MSDAAPGAPAKLPARPHSSIYRRQYAELQRARLIAAVLAVVQQRGFRRLTVAAVSAGAKVSRKTFYESFTDCEDAFLAAFEHAARCVREAAVDAYTREPDWRSGIREALHRVLGLLDEQPALAKVCLVDSLAAGERVRRRRAELIDELARAVDRGRLAGRLGQAPSPLTSELLVGGVLSTLERRLPTSGKTPLVELRGELMSVLVLPYLGTRSARREPEIRCGAAVVPEWPAPAPELDPLKAPRLRITYRTVRALMAIAESPGCSNRDVAEGAGIVDQGQVSKLLSRLAGLGLIENRGVGQPAGGANAWWLTAHGARLEQVSRLRLA